MKVNNKLSSSEEYLVSTPLYHGPLDLLLQLIERAELDITKLALAQVTAQYLEYIKNLPQLSLDEVSAFLVVAAKLIQIKSEFLLPHPPTREVGEEDLGEALARQLSLYRQFKRIADHLDDMQKLDRRTYLSLASIPIIESKPDLQGLELMDLVDAALLAYARKPEQSQSLETTISTPKVTIREKIRFMTDQLRRFGHSTFKALLGQERTRVDIVVTFLAMLELVKMHFVEAQQDKLFEDINIEPGPGWESKEEIELEFGE